MLKYAILFAVVGTALGSSVGSRSLGIDRPPIDNSNVFDCSSRPDLPLLAHPSDCTRFIQCTNGRTVDHACADCDKNNIKECQDSDYLVFDPSVNATSCIYPSESDKCGGGGGGKPPSTTPTSGTTSDDETTTPKLGEDCEADNCTVVGDCFGYRYCKRNSEDPADDSGTIVLGKCPDGLYFEPRPRAPARRPTVVAHCLPFIQLDPETKKEYLSVKNCTYCEIIPLGKCQTTYKFRDEDGVTTIETCAPNVYSRDLRACVPTSECNDA